MRDAYVVVCLLFSALTGLVACGDNLQGNRPPVASDSNVTTPEDTPVSMTVNVTDPDPDAELTFVFSAPEHGTITQDGRTVTYRPDDDYHGPDSIHVEISDGTHEVEADITITVTPVNDAPVAADDTLAGNEDAAATVTGAALVANDTDVEDDALTVTAVGTASVGTVELSGDTITYTPPADFTGAATFEYTVSDGEATDTGTVTVNVGGVNDPPVAVNDALTTAEDTPGTITTATLVANDTDTELQTLSVTGVGGAVNGTVDLAGGTVTFTPDANYSGAASFTYTVSDGAATATGTVDVTVTPVNDAPVANAGTAQTDEDTAVTITLTGSDVEGSSLTFAIVTQPANGTLGAITQVDATSATVVYTPDTDSTMDDSFTFEVNDGDLDSAPATVAIDVVPVNDGPVANAQSVTTDEDTAVVITVSGSDLDGDTLSFATGTGPANGTLGAYTQVTATTATVTYTPAADFSGSDSFTFTAGDGTATSAPATVSITVTAANDAPVATTGTTTTDEDTAVTITLAGTDAEGQPLTFAVGTAPARGSLGAITQLTPTTASVTYTPAANDDQDDSFTFTVNDGTATSAPATVSIDVVPVNDNPVAVNDADSTERNTPMARPAATYAGNDTDIDGPGPLTVTAVQDPVNGTVALAAGTITFTPDTDFSGEAGFDYVVSDGDGGTDVGHVTVTVIATNTPPVAVDDTDDTDEDTALVVLASVYTANDIDPDPQTLTITAVQNPVNGTVTIDVPTQTITFTPTTNYAGPASFDYVVSDGIATDVGLVNVTVNAADDLPVANDDTATVDEDGDVTTNVLANDTGLGDGGLTVTIEVAATSGTAVAQGDNTVLYTPTADFNGTDTYSYRVEDADGDFAVAVVTVTVAPVNDAPVAQAQSRTMNENTTVTITLTGTDIDVPAQQLTFAVGTAPTNGALGTITSTGLTTATVDYTPTADFVGPDSFTFTVDDGTATSAPATVSITVENVAVCGDGLLEGLEACDDDNEDPGDGCSAACLVEDGWDCDGEPSLCTTVCGDGIVVAGEEECDDENAVDTDGCTTQCVAGPVCTVAIFADGDRFATDPATGHCYVSFDGEQTSFAEAQTACVAVTGHLVSITSEAEQTIAASVQNPAENPWIGLADEIVEGSFGWVTGEALGYTNWSMSQPDGGDPEDCVNFFDTTLSSTGLAGTWNDTSCANTGFTAGRICEIEENPCGNGTLEAGLAEACDDGNTDNFDGCNATCELETLFFSEYIEGSGTGNKAVEIANPFLAPIDLTGCALRLYTNGSPTVSQTVTLTQTIDPGDVLVVCNSAANVAITSQCDVTSNAVMNHNGDDAIELFCNGATVDVIGQIGFDPGSEWGTGATSTENNTLRRKCSVTRGDTVGNDAFVPADEWGGFPLDTFDGFGSYQCVP